LTDFLLFVVGACGAPRRRRRRRQATTLRASDANSRTAGLEIRTAISVSAEYPTCALELILRHEQPHAVDAAFPRRADADDDARHAFGLERDPVEVGLDAGRVGHERNHLRVHSASPLVEIANPWRRPRRPIAPARGARRPTPCISKQNRLGMRFATLRRSVVIPAIAEAP